MSGIYDEDEEFEDEIGDPVEIERYTRPEEDPKRELGPTPEQIASTQAEIDRAIEARKETKRLKKEANALGIRDPKSGKLHPLDKLVPTIEQAYQTDEEVEMDEIRKEARQNLKALIPFLTRMMSSENDKIAMDAGTKLFEISFGKIGTMEKPVDPNKDIAFIVPVFYQELEDKELYEVPELD